MYFAASLNPTVLKGEYEKLLCKYHDAALKTIVSIIIERYSSNLVPTISEIRAIGSEVLNNLKPIESKIDVNTGDTESFVKLLKLLTFLIDKKIVITGKKRIYNLPCDSRVFLSDILSIVPSKFNAPKEYYDYMYNILSKIEVKNGDSSQNNQV